MMAGNSTGSVAQLGLLIINKPAGVTSRDVVNRVARVLGTKQVGHAGTLDPLATGVVVICIGKATKLIDFIHQHKKEYAASFLLGRSSPSDDFETELTIEPDPHVPTDSELELAVATQRGHVSQRPCNFSAKLIGGQRAYQLARKGRVVELPPKQVEIARLVIGAYCWPRFELEVTCSTGTFVRAIGRDVAAAANTTAVMEQLTRTAVGPFRLESAIPLPDRDVTVEHSRQRLQDAVISPLAAVSHLPSAVLEETERELAIRGGHLHLPQHANSATIAAVDANQEMLGVLRRLDGGAYRLRPNFLGHS
jgi:tRNA pseudouridine55 synthase